MEGIEMMIGDDMDGIALMVGFYGNDVCVLVALSRGCGGHGLGPQDPGSNDENVRLSSAVTTLPLALSDALSSILRCFSSTNKRFAGEDKSPRLCSQGLFVSI
jgi:hypothetical protein